MQKRQTRLPEMPEFGGDGMLFTLKTITYSPETPRLEEPFVVKGKVELFGIPYVAPLWVIAKVTAPETWWEHYIPIWGSPTVGEGQMALGGDFEITFPKGFDREGEFSLAVEVYLGPTYTLDSITLPPFPPLASEETTFIVAGEALPPEERFHDFRIVSYSKNGGPPVTLPGSLELEVGDRCRVNLAFEHKGAAETGKFHAAIWTPQPWDPHDEILNKEQSFSVPSSAEWETAEYSVDIVITSAISPGSYGLYCKIMGITGTDVFTPYYENVITIVGVPPEGIFSNLQIIDYENTLNIGDTCHVRVNFDYQGPRLTRTLYAAIWQHKAWDPHDEILKGSKTITVPESEVPTTYEGEVSIPITTAIDPGGSPYGLYAKICHGILCGIVDTLSPYLDNVITIIGEEIDFSLSKPSAYPFSAPPGPVKITCPVTSQSTKSVTAVVKCLVYEGSILPGHGTKLWEKTKTVTFSPGQTKNVEFMRTSVVGTIDRRDVEVEVRVGGQLIVQDEWDDVYYVEEAPPVGISFQMGIWGAPNDFPLYYYWMCWYWDNGIGGYVSDEQWYRPYQKIQFTNIKSGDNGYVSVFLRKNSAVSPQYTSPRFDAVDGGSFTYDVGINHIY